MLLAPSPVALDAWRACDGGVGARSSLSRGSLCAAPVPSPSEDRLGQESEPTWSTNSWVSLSSTLAGETRVRRLQNGCCR